jgi:hypothetical protein
MAIYSIHCSPLAGGRDAEAEALKATKLGFCYPAFVFGPLWLAAHRLWLPLLAYVVGLAVVALLAALGVVPPGAAVALELLAAVLIGVEGREWLGLAWERRGQPLVDFIEARDADEAARRYFERVLAVPPAPSGARIASPPRASGIIGSFPEANGR